MKEFLAGLTLALALLAGALLAYDALDVTVADAVDNPGVHLHDEG